VVLCVRYSRIRKRRNRLIENRTCFPILLPVSLYFSSTNCSPFPRSCTYAFSYSVSPLIRIRRYRDHWLSRGEPSSKARLGTVVCWPKQVCSKNPHVYLVRPGYALKKLRSERPHCLVSSNLLYKSITSAITSLAPSSFPLPQRSLLATCLNQREKSN
jgi:hypothetical protein